MTKPAPGGPATAFSLLVLTGPPPPTRLFLKKSRTSLPYPVRVEVKMLSRQLNAYWRLVLGWAGGMTISLGHSHPLIKI